MRMALRQGKLDAICARLKKTSAVDVRATSQNGVSEDTSITRNIDDAGVETKASINNNNEDTVTDLNETPSLCPAPGLEGENAATLEAKPMTVSTSPPNTLRQCPTSMAGRRKKRKNSQPRNVLKVEEDFDGDVDDGIEPFAKQFKINSIFSPSPIQEKSIGTKSSNDAQPMHVPLSQIPSNQYFLQQQNEVGVNFLYRPDHHDKLEKNFPLDLSTCKPSGGSFAENSEEKSAGLIANSFFYKTSHTRSAEGPSAALCGGEGHPQMQAKVLADYAENTMNELLSIYGFEGGGADKVERGKGLRHKHLQTISPSKSSVPRAESSLPATCVLPHAPLPSPPPADISNGQVLLKDAAISANSLPSYEGTSASSNAKPTNKLSRKEGHLKIRSHSLKSVKQAGILQKHVSSDYAKYIKKFHNGNECEGSHCKDLGYREHYHCLDCNFKVFIKKEEMVRHYKWHKKRDESLQHGFMRYSPLDDCSTKFGSCTHNHRQTHYHCVQAGCDKVYISTSDVQMHSNYHRKDSAIIQEGFQRFRATEDCGTTKCNFYGQRTTHFHCRRPNCNFTFKNKADMEKHKSYHQKDEILGKDGFKKFMKYEHCSYNGCRFSKISNHIHCIRPGCTYVLHSTAQLYSHKRKHERREFENIYRTFKQAQRNPGLQSQPSTQAVSTLKSCGTQLVSTVATLPLNMQLASPSLIASLPAQAIGEPMVARGVVSGQAVRPIALPVTVAAASAPVLPHPVLTSPPVRSAVFSPALPQAVSDAAAVSMPMHVKTENEDTKSFSDSCTTATFTALKVKLETKSDSGSDAEEDAAAIKGEDASTPSLLEESVSDLKKTNLQDSLTVPISGKANLQDSLNVPILGETNLQDSLNVLIPGEINNIETDQEQGNGGQVIGKTSSDGNLCAEASGDKSPPLQPVQPKVRKIGAPEKRDRDESWKNYLIRYTANDPCNSRCALLYKDHYHCKISGCQVLFKSKDGVREHAKFHDLQDRVTPLMYNKYDSQQPCPETCQYNLKDTHYHCKWTGCTHAISETGSTFGRLEHYRIHEFAKAASGKNCRMPSSLNSSAEDALAQRRRGRPPKYPRMDVPLVPKVELSETEIKESSAVTASMETIEGKCQVINGFRRFEAGEPCPDEQCMYFMQVHYHCGRPRCHTATDRVDVLNLHAKDFHSFVNILEHFEFFDRNVNCRRVHCHNNGTNRHYHCTRPRCDYSFVRHSTMTQHDRKHMSGSSSGSKTVTATLATPRLTPIQLVRHPDGQTYIPIVSALDPQNKNIVKASGTFYPLSTVPGLPATAVTLAPAPLAVATSGVQQLGTSSLAFTIPANLVTATIPVMAQTLTTSSPSTSIVPVIAAGSVVTTAGTVASINNPPLTVLLQQKSGKEVSQPSWTSMRNNMHYSLQASCGRPFCKLKKKDHFHCLECNQAFSDPARLRGHISKHGVRFRKLVHEMRAIKPLPLTAVTTLQSSGEVGLDLSTTKGKQDPAIGASTAAPSEDKTDSSNTGEEQETGEETEDSVIPLRFDSPTPSLRWETSSPAGAVFDASEERPLVIDEEINEYSDDSSWLANESVDRREDSREQDSSSEPASPVDNSVDGTDTSAATSPAASRRSVRRRTSTKHEDYMSGADSALARQMKLKLNAPIPSTAPRVNKQIPDGFIRFHCSSDCGHQRCAYRQTVTHYHCLRPECGYGFSDKSRIIQHRVRHERIDQLMGEDFQQFRATVSCSHPNCVFAEKSSHFHCRKCSFMCADSSKVLAHRKYHAKLDNINNNGFQKFTGSEDCHIPSCTYYCKQTHYHCMYTGCNHAVLGPAQMAPHKLKHACREM